nr:hypothetical protein [Moritella viscosa]SHO14676.1 Putative uncharacterized protein [Moritella viscosa]
MEQIKLQKSIRMLFIALLTVFTLFISTVQANELEQEPQPVEQTVIKVVFNDGKQENFYARGTLQDGDEILRTLNLLGANTDSIDTIALNDDEPINYDTDYTEARGLNSTDTSDSDNNKVRILLKFLIIMQTIFFGIVAASSKN